LLEEDKEDFSGMYGYFRKRLALNVDFFEKLAVDQTVLGGIDAFFNGYRRYDSADNLICVLALANVTELQGVKLFRKRK
jgi:hypothetical protein